MKIITLMENEACGGLTAARGLSQYIETPKHKILFDMGPDGAFLENAEKLGVDLAAVDVAVLSHGHSDHGGGLRAFCEVNSRADVLVHPDAFGDFYAVVPGEDPRYIGLEADIWELESRVVPTAPGLRLDEELSLLGDIPNTFPFSRSPKPRFRRSVVPVVHSLGKHHMAMGIPFSVAFMDGKARSEERRCRERV